MASIISFPRDFLKDTEARIHEALFSNIQLLTYKFKPSDVFQKVFRPDMFKKSNVAAFQQVSYYLLNALNPELTRKMITAWPIFEKVQEASFRKEVIILIDEINNLYFHADLPKLMHSHYVIPGGLKIATLIFSLSQLVLYEELKRSGCEMSLMPSKANDDPKVTDLTIKTIQRTTKSDMDKVEKIIEECEESRNQALDKAEQMILENEQVAEDLSQCRKALMEKQANYKGPTLEEVRKQVQHVKDRLKNIENVSQVFTEIITSQTLLVSGETVLNYNKDEFAISDNVAQEIEDKEGKLDLRRLFYYLENSISQAKFHGYNLLELEEIRKLVDYLKEQYLYLERSNETNFKKLHEVISLFDSVIKLN